VAIEAGDEDRVSRLRGPKEVIEPVLHTEVDSAEANSNEGAVQNGQPD
jgi:hypothetical protein